MDKLQILERYYNAFIDQKDPKAFFLGLADYLDYGETVAEFDHLTSQISAQAKPVTDKYEEQHKIALEKVAAVHKELAAYIKKKKVDKPAITEAFREYKSYIDGHTHSSSPLAYSLHDELHDVVEFLYAVPEHKDFASKYIEFSDKEKTRLRRYLPIKEVDEFLETKNELRRGYEDGLWGAQAQIYELYDVIRKGRDRHKKIVERYKKRERGASFDLLNFGVIMGEWVKVEESRLDRDPVFFSIKKVAPWAQRFHTYVVAHFTEATTMLAEIKRQQEEERRLTTEPSSGAIGQNDVREVDKFPYLKDYQLYALWCYVNGHLIGRPVFQFQDLVAPHASEMLVIQFVLTHFELWGVSFEKPIFHKDIYLEWSGSAYKALLERLERAKTDTAKKVLEKILNNDFTVADLKQGQLPLQSAGLFEYIEFGKELSPENRAKIAPFIDRYIDEFMRDNLEIDDANFYAFHLQKARLVNLLQDRQQQFGNSFILKYWPHGNELGPTERDPYLFIHSIIAIEKLGLIKIERVWVEDDTAPEDQTLDYKVKLTVLQDLGSFMRPAPEIKAPVEAAIKKPTLLIEGKMGYLKFYKEGQRILVGKVDTRKYRLLSVLWEPLGVARAIDVVFEAVKDPKDNSDGRLKDRYTAPARQREIIDYTMKELQKIKGLKGRISLAYHHDGSTVALKIK